MFRNRCVFLEFAAGVALDAQDWVWKEELVGGWGERDGLVGLYDLDMDVHWKISQTKKLQLRIFESIRRFVRCLRCTEREKSKKGLKFTRISYFVTLQLLSVFGLCQIALVRAIARKGQNPATYFVFDCVCSCLKVGEWMTVSEHE